MRIIPRIFVATLAVALMLGGCVPTTPSASPTPKTSATPVFASEAEALAAATKAYAAYQEMLDEAFATYDASRLERVATGTALKKAKESVSAYRGSGKRQTGGATIDSVSLIGSEPLLLGDSETTRTQAYLCLDLTQVDVVGSDGMSVVPSGSDRRFPIIATFVWQRSPGVLLVEGDESWSGEYFC
ncbi:hypothetical protein [Lacisediminihabitans sp. H27-G8]|uniref:hypothetical protein n=1 Tax=Lacisediminihabitans sp. H27-G8 TaxID=3111909 RepID=UPI0038FCE522